MIQALVASGLLLGATGAQPQVGLEPKVELDFDRTADFGRFKTFAWSPAQEPAANPANHVRLTRAIERELQAKGLAKAQSAAEADLFVLYHGHREKRVRGTPSREESVWQPSSPKFSVDFGRVEIGTLAIHLWDGTNKKTVWSAVGEERIRETDEAEDVIDTVVKRLLGHYPPKPEPGAKE